MIRAIAAAARLIDDQIALIEADVLDLLRQAAERGR
jgi:hypothetical protein